MNILDLREGVKLDIADRYDIIGESGLDKASVGITQYLFTDDELDKWSGHCCEEDKQARILFGCDGNSMKSVVLMPSNIAIAYNCTVNSAEKLLDEIIASIHHESPGITQAGIIKMFSTARGQLISEVTA